MPSASEGRRTGGQAGIFNFKFSLRWAVLALFFVVEDGDVGFVARGGDALFLKGAEHGATRFVGVSAVAKPAIGRNAEDFGEIV